MVHLMVRSEFGPGDDAIVRVGLRRKGPEGQIKKTRTRTQVDKRFLGHPDLRIDCADMGSSILAPYEEASGHARESGVERKKRCGGAKSLH